MADASQMFNKFGLKPMSDRRIIQRFVNAWAAAARGAFPNWRQLRTIDLGSDWNWVFVVDLERSVGYPHFDYLGPRLAELAEVYLAGGGEWAVSVLDKVAEDINAAVADAGPHMREDVLTLANGGALLVRCMTAPLSSEDDAEGRGIAKVVGVVSGRIGHLDDLAYDPVNDDVVADRR